MRNRHRYPRQWHDTIRPEIIKRDEYKCKLCGIKHRQLVAKKETVGLIRIDNDEMNDYKDNGYKVYRIYLQVAHRDNDPTNNNYENLVSLCVACHARIDAPYKRLRRIGQLHMRFDKGIEE